MIVKCRFKKTTEINQQSALTSLLIALEAQGHQAIHISVIHQVSGLFQTFLLSRPRKEPTKI